MTMQIKNLVKESIETKQLLLDDENQLIVIQKMIDVITQAFQSGNKVLFCGNGGSAADAQHLAAEFSGRFYRDRVALPAEALHTNTSYLTAVANDYGFEQIYARLVEGIGTKGDVLVSLSTSGNSPNIIHAMMAARSKGMFNIGLTGNKNGEMVGLSDLVLEVPSSVTPRIQECHMLVGHIICQKVEENLFSKK